MDENRPKTSEPTENSVGLNRIKKIDISKLPAIPAVGGIIIVLILVAGVMFFLRSSRVIKFSPTESKAQKETSAGNYNDAISTLKQGLRSDPNNQSLLSGIVSNYSLLGNQTGTEAQQLKNAQTYIDQLQKLNPNASSLIAIGYAYESSGDYEKALEFYTKATQVSPKFALAWFHKAHAEQFLNKISDSDKSYDTAYALDPNNSLILMARGNMYYLQGNAQKAFDAYKLAAQNANSAPQVKVEALAAASWIRRSQDNFSHVGEALSLAKQALDIDPNFSPALAAYGNALFLSGKTDEGISYLKKAIAANPRISRNYADLGMVMRSKKDFTGSINYLDEALIRVNDDNTLVTITNKRRAQALYKYELALSYSMAGSNVNVTKLISEAVSIDHNILSQAKYDYEKRGFFKELSGNAQFQNLIKS